MRRRMLGIILCINLMLIFVSCGENKQTGNLLRSADYSLNKAKSIDADIQLNGRIKLEKQKHTIELPIQLKARLQIAKEKIKLRGKFNMIQENELFKVLAIFEKNRLKIYFKEGATEDWNQYNTNISKEILGSFRISFNRLCSGFTTKEKTNEYDMSGQLDLNSNNDLIQLLRSGIEQLGKKMGINDLGLKAENPQLQLVITRDTKKYKRLKLTFQKIDLSSIIQKYIGEKSKGTIHDLSMSIGFRQ